MKIKPGWLLMKLGLCLGLFIGLVQVKTAFSQNSGWEMEIVGIGQKLEGAVYESWVRLGLDDIAITTPPPFPPPSYTIDLKIMKDSIELKQDIRQLSSLNQEIWQLNVEIGPYADHSLNDYYPQLFWDTNQTVNGKIELRRGVDENGQFIENGEILVTNMSTTNTYQTQEADGEYIPDIDQAFLTYAIVFTPAPVITSSSPLFSIKVGEKFTYISEATGPLPITWSLEGDLSFMLIDPNSGEIDWTPDPNQVGVISITLKAENYGGEISQVFDLAILPEITSDAPLTAKVGQEYTYSPQVLGKGAVQWDLIQNPPGMTLDDQTGQTKVIWTPQVVDLGASPSITLKVNVNGQEDSQTWTVTVEEGESGDDNDAGGVGGCFLSTLFTTNR